jgi:hypothetical protein
MYGYHMKLYLEIVGRFPEGSMSGSRDNSESNSNKSGRVNLFNYCSELTIPAP